jgi:dienelactone hydrolase
MKVNRMKRVLILLFTLALNSIAVLAQDKEIVGPDTVIVSSDTVQLRALVWRPKQNGPFPAIFFSHGRSITLEERIKKTSQINILGELFARHGYLFFALFRRGEGLSLDQGIQITQLLERERTAKGPEAADQLQVHLLESRELPDALAGLAKLKSISTVDPNRIGVVGHSFGGSLSLLLASRDTTLKAAANFAGAAGSWKLLDLQRALIDAVERLNTAVFFAFAANDYSVEPGKILNGKMAAQGKIHQLKIFPSFGTSAAEGHNIIYDAIDQWESDVFAFLDKYVKR